MATDRDDYIEKMKTLNENTVYELVDTKTADRYVGQTRKDLQKTRRPQHFAEARSGREDRDLHAHLQQVEDEGREADVEIRALDFPSEHRAIEAIGQEALLNATAGDKKPAGGGYDWTPGELEVIEQHPADEAVEILVDEHGRDRANLKNKIRDTRAQLGLSKRSTIDWPRWDDLLGTMPDKDLAERIGCERATVTRRRLELGIERHCPPGAPLTRDDVLTIWIIYHLDESQSYRDVAERVEDHDIDVTQGQVGGIIREDSYTDVHRPAPAAIQAAEAYVDAAAAFRAGAGGSE